MRSYLKLRNTPNSCSETRVPVFVLFLVFHFSCGLSKSLPRAPVEWIFGHPAPSHPGAGLVQLLGAQKLKILGKKTGIGVFIISLRSVTAAFMMVSCSTMVVVTSIWCGLIYA